MEPTPDTSTRISLIAVVGDDVLHPISDGDHQLLRVQTNQLPETVRENRLSRDFAHSLGLVFGQRAKPRPFTRGEDDCLHMLGLARKS